MKPTRIPLVLIILAAAALVGVGCGGSSSKSSDSATKQDPPKKVALGMDEDALCTVFGAPIASDDVSDLADEAQGAFEKAREDVDVADVDLDGYDGSLDTFEIVALDQLIDDQIMRNEAKKLDVSVSAADGDDALDAIAEDAGIDADDVIDAMADATGFSTSTLRATAAQSALRAAVFDELDAADASEYEDAAEWVRDELRPAADKADAIVCAKGIEWDEDLRDTLELPKGERVAFGDDIVNPLIADAMAQAGKPSPVSLGIDYEDQVVPLLGDFDPMLVRFISVFKKFDSGSIDLRRVSEGMGRQVTDMRKLQATAAAVRIDDPYLQRNHRQLVLALTSYANGLDAIRKLVNSSTQSQVNAHEKTFNQQMNRADKALTAWATGLDNDPEDRVFARSAAAAVALAKTADALN